MVSTKPLLPKDVEIVVLNLYGCFGGYPMMPHQAMSCIQFNVIVDQSFVDVMSNIGPACSSSRGINYPHQYWYQRTYPWPPRLSYYSNVNNCWVPQYERNFICGLSYYLGQYHHSKPY